MGHSFWGGGQRGLTVALVAGPDRLRAVGQRPLGSGRSGRERAGAGRGRAGAGAVYQQYFQKGRFPARSAIGTSGLYGGARVEISCTAVVK